MRRDERELHLAWQRHVGTGTAAEGWFDTVVGAHRDVGRHYHDVRHVRWVVQHGRELAADAGLADELVDRIVAAGFFHDVVYDATADDNEQVSAAMARRALTEIGWAADPVDQVAAMIEATVGHRGSDDRATQVLLAADLGVLATEPGRYTDYVRNVRREYHHLDDATWRAGRAMFVRTMLARPSIFPPGLGLDSWERRARANLTAELAAEESLSDGRGADAREP